MFMGTITINVNNIIEQYFRKRVYQLYGKKKGMLGKALTEAMQEWSRKKDSFDKCMYLLEKGADMGKLKYKEREELYDRD